MQWHMHAEARPLSRSAINLEAASQVLNSFAHSDQPEVRAGTRENLFRVESYAIVRDPHVHFVSVKIDVNAHFLWLRMINGIGDCLSRHHQQDILHRPVEWQRFAGGLKVHGHARHVADLLRHTSQQLRYRRRRSFLLAKVPDRLARFIHGGTYLSARRVQEIFSRPLRFRFERYDSFQQRRGARAALDHGIVHFTRNTISFFQYGLEPGMHLAQPEPIDEDDPADDHQRTECQEPCGTVQMRAPNHLQGRFRYLIRHIHFKRLNPELILAWRQTRIVSRARAERLRPVVVEPLQLVAEANAFLRSQANGTVLDLELPFSGRHHQASRIRYFLPVNQCLFDHYLR